MTRPALPYDYTCFADEVLHLKRVYLKVGFKFFKCVIYYIIMKKSIIYDIKNKFVLLIFLHLQKMSLFVDIQPTFPPV